MRRRTEVTLDTGSFRDPSGFIFFHEGVVHRQINACYRQDYEALLHSGLYRELVERRLLIPHEEVQVRPPARRVAYKVIRPETIAFISYPYEWCFGQLKDAALVTLEIQERALRRDMSLKDASAYNIQFHRGSPVLIDTLSFERLRPGEPWIAYRQFCRHFLGPLALMAHRDVRLGQWARLDIEGVPLELASRILPWRTRLSLSLLMHIHLHAGAQRRFAGASVADRRGKRRMGKRALLGLVDSLKRAVQGLAWRPEGTPWADYAQDHNYTPQALEAKRSIVSDWLDRLAPGSVWDLGANVGAFSRLASQRGSTTIAFDYDYGAVELNYEQCKQDSEPDLLPLVLDLTNPSPGVGWQNRERFSLRERGPADLVMALALIHHLVIGNNVPLGAVFEFLASLGGWLIIEFAPKSDSQVQRLLANRADIFADFHREGFEAASQAHYRIEAAEALPDSERRMYLMEALS